MPWPHQRSNLVKRLSFSSFARRRSDDLAAAPPEPTERSIAATCPRSTPSRPTDVLLLKRCVANSKTDTGTRLANNPIVIRGAGQLSPWTMAHFLLGRELHGRASRISGVR